MAPYIFGARNNIHIIDLAQTVPLLHQALKVVSDTVARGGRVLFVGTKRQAQDQIADAARRSAQYYINSRWLGGMLTNWKTISGSIQRLRKIDEQLDGGATGLTKKERLMMSREREKLEKALGGIKDMGGVPDLIFVIDTNKEQLAIKEANRLNIPVAAILDTNSDPDGITFPIPGNDDAGRAIAMYCDLVARAALDGIQRSQGSAGVDFGASEEPTAEVLPGQVHEDLSEPTGAEVSPVETLEAPAEAFEILSAPRGAPDDFAKIQGVGPQIVKKLNDGGIFHYWADRGDDAGRRHQGRGRPEARRPHQPRRLDQPGPRAARRLIDPDRRLPFAGDGLAAKPRWTRLGYCHSLVRPRVARLSNRRMPGDP